MLMNSRGLQSWWDLECYSEERDKLVEQKRQRGIPHNLKKQGERKERPESERWQDDGPGWDQVEHQKSWAKAGEAECAETFTEPKSNKDNCSQEFLSLPLQQILRKAKAKNRLIFLHKHFPMIVEDKD